MSLLVWVFLRRSESIRVLQAAHISTVYPPPIQIHHLRHTHLLPRMQLTPPSSPFLHQPTTATILLHQSTTTSNITLNQETKRPTQSHDSLQLCLFLSNTTSWDTTSVSAPIGGELTRLTTGNPTIAAPNRIMTGWADRFSLGHVSPAYSPLNRHAVRRLHRWLCLKHKTETGKCVRFPDTRLRDDYGLALLSRRATGLPSARALSRPEAGGLCCKVRLFGDVSA